MSMERKASNRAPTRCAKPSIDNPGSTEMPAVDTIDVDRLEIEESYDVNCDPYNSTGQHLADTVKKRYED